MKHTIKEFFIDTNKLNIEEMKNAIPSKSRR